MQSHNSTRNHQEQKLQRNTDREQRSYSNRKELRLMNKRNHIIHHLKRTAKTDDTWLEGARKLESLLLGPDPHGTFKDRNFGGGAGELPFTM
eukprot:NODE_6868_length_602_cov_3.179024_g5876_i0.p1 GENE.NODE_6868_length_602_cov_3.179024_g5876_i0~~NODE_6868_length_602_cov_3.179024_g5876_i0.p1  ORF type:complete len:92 (-),score=0.60 NODE_6868_length_602_cov_3.179024_g5876_i0:69-344(-)